MAARPRESRAFLAWACLLTLAVAARFYLPARAVSGGDWPAPLDDVYIHFDYARAWATGHPFEWIAGQGYASGETSPAYAVVLAVGYAIGFHGLWLGVWAAMIACASLVFMMRALRLLLVPSPAWVAMLATTMLLTCGTLDFAWFSGMEVALFGAVAAALVVAAARARNAGPMERARRQWWVGVLGALLVLVRPEAAVVVAVATFVVARRPGAQSAFVASVRVALPGALATLAVAALNRAYTGDAASAGAALKLLSSNPFATDEDRARDYLVNLVSFVRTMAHDLGDRSGHGASALPVLALLSLTSRRTRGLGVLCLGGALAFVLLVSWNGAARFQTFRDYMPAVALFVFAAALGVGALAQRTLGRALGASLVLAGVCLGGSHVGEAARFYARASRNIHDQQVAVGRWLASESPKEAIVLVGDAGAIPYLSRLHAVDALGLGGYHGMPFVRAAVEGEAATLELIERLPPYERPTLLALYPNWFPGITMTFGHEKKRFTIEDNVICGGVTKVVYDADWSALADSAETAAPDEILGDAVLDELDVGDVISEEAHAYVSPAPRGGWTLFDVRASGGGARRFDAGRVIPDGQEESFALAKGAPEGAFVTMRTDDSSGDVTLRVSSNRHGSVAVPLVRVGAPVPGRWGILRAVLPVAVEEGDRVHLSVAHGELHDFHVWVASGADR